MFGAVERMVAARYLRARRREGFISVIAWFSFLGIALGVATLIIVLAVMNGFRHELLTRILGINGHVMVVGGGALAEFDAVAERTRRVSGVVSVIPVIEGQVMVTAREVAAGAIVRGIRPADLMARALIADNIRAGSLAALASGDGVVIGTRMARRFGVGVGDQITLIAPQGSTTALGTVPRLRAYAVVAIFEIGMSEYDANFIFMPFEAAQVFFRLKERASFLEVMVAEPTRLHPVREDIARALPPETTVLDWQQTNANFFGAIQVERNVMFLILTLIILVAAFNIVSSLIMLVKDKGRDIAILRTMGATRGAIMRVFFMNGAAIGVAGTVAGFALGLGFSLNIEAVRRFLERFTDTDLFSAEIYFLSRLPARVEVEDVAAVVLIALVLSLLATIYPAWRAATLDPVEALRYE
ncbi:MAG: lipoprotein-releasing ABC transporter permease subunit [Alphaproteobacteria bacterium]|nr:lipoprotein-releasing ABC transporter permease subunit [Alphaproteobacteria bacterium]